MEDSIIKIISIFLITNIVIGILNIFLTVKMIKVSGVNRRKNNEQ